MFRKFFSELDLYLIIPAFLLVFLSFFVLSAFNLSLARTQLVYATIGFIFYFAIMHIHPDFLKQYALPYYFFILLLLVIVFFIGEISHGANRWIGLWGETTLQPSEFAKPAIILLLSVYFSQQHVMSLQLLTRTAIPTIVFFLLIFHQPDLATASLFLFIWVLCIYLTDTSLKMFLGVILSVILFFCLSAPFIWNSLHDYQRNRILVFLDPERDPLGTGYHVLQAMITVGSGEVLGKGFARGTQTNNNFLPEHYTDFAFAAFSEQFGFVGASILIFLYAFLLYRIFILAKRATNRFNSYICLTVGGLIFIQMFVNIGMNTGIVPVAGITLPMFSYGGSSLISFLICLGLVQCVSKDRTSHVGVVNSV
jgi:rod shape determining protein RodA